VIFYLWWCDNNSLRYSTLSNRQYRACSSEACSK